MKTLEKLTNRLKSKKNSNKGFTLVELIVVVVILAIIIGVAITGIYKYVNKARINTDINNASAIQSALAVLATEKDIIKANSSGENKIRACEVSWTDALDTVAASNLSNTITGLPEGITAEAYDDATKDKLVTMINSVLSDGLPEAKAGGSFRLVISTDETGNVKVSCKGYDSAGTKLTAEN